MRGLIGQTLSVCAFGMAVVVLSACAVVPRAPVPTGTIPPAHAASSEAEQYGQYLFDDLRSDYRLDEISDRNARLMAIFNAVAGAAGVDPHTWHVYLFDDPQAVDVRAVHGNHLFVWSGVFDVVGSDDELAGLVACELAHSLAHHTDPVQFGVGSEILFAIGDVFTTVGAAAISGGMLAVNAPGLTRWAYIEAADLDPLDRVYTDEEVEEMASIALLILGESEYSPDALLTFWTRVQADSALREKVAPLIREMPPQERVALVEATMLKLATWTRANGNGGLAAEPAEPEQVSTSESQEDSGT